MNMAKRSKKSAPKKTGPKTAAGKKRSQSNLKPFMKGRSGNPKGRPPGSSLTKHMRLLLDRSAATTPWVAKIVREEMNLDPAGFTVGEALAYSAVGDALLGNVRKFELILERMDGKLAQTFNQNIDGKMNISDAMAVVQQSEEEDETD